MPTTLTDLLTDLENHRAVIGIIGLGYVGLPLAVEFGKRYRTLGFDIKPERIDALRQGRDVTREVTDDELAAISHLTLTANPEDLAQCSVYVVTVPTPIDTAKRPDFGPLIRAAEYVDWSPITST